MPGFPNVPNVPGVPPLLRDPNVASASLTLLVTDLVRFLVSGGAPQWGVFKDGAPVVLCESVLSVDYRQDWRLATFPIEEGGFETYDKVSMPFDVRVRFAAGGSPQARQDLIDTAKAIAGDLLSYDVATPEEIFQGMNVMHVDYSRRAERGVGLVTLDMWLNEIRTTAAAQFTTTKAPNAAGTVHGGTVSIAPGPTSSGFKPSGVQ